MILGHVDDQPVELIFNDSDDPKQPALYWKFGAEIVKTPGEAMDRIVQSARKSGLPACRMVDRKAVRKAQDALISHQRELLAEAYKKRIEGMESDPACPRQMIEMERAEHQRVMKLLQQG